MKRSILVAGGVLIASASLIAAGCGSSSTPSTDTASSGGGEAPAGAAVGSGATFPATAYTKWCQESETCTYAAKGSGAGIKDLTAGTVAWAGSDAPLDADEQKAIGKTVYYFPTLLGAIAVPTNIDGVTKAINLTGPALAGIFDGDITNWNDQDIATSNPGVTLPDKPIAVCVRADSSGTSYNFSGYLSQISQGFADKVGAEASKTPSWSAKVIASPGNPGVAQCVKTNVNSIGYVDYAEAKLAGLADKSTLIGDEGNYVGPTTAAVEAAAASAELPDNLLINVLNSQAKGAYPLVATTYALAVDGAKDNAAVKKVLTYFLGSTAQGQLDTLGYAPLPAEVNKAATAQLAKLG
ncbi:MAG: phosphate ABC transporter substrate-binding protein PstS [Actinomycetota bacterium]